MAHPALTPALRETLALFDGHGEPRATSELAEQLDLGRRSTYERLERLVDQGRLATKKVGANARVWWRPHTDASDDTPGPARAREELASLVEAVDEYALFTLDPEGYVRTWNPGAEEIKGYAEAEIVGEHFSTFYPAEAQEAGVPMRNLAAAARDGSIEEQGWRVRADGSRFWANVTITAIRDEDGALEGFAKVTRDMTDRRTRERELRRERDLVGRILNTVPVGVGVVSTDGELRRLNERATEILGRDGDDEATVDTSTLYDENGDPVPTAEQPAARAFETGEAVRDWRCQFDDPDGGRRWLSVNAAPLEDGDGASEQVVLTVEDITQQKEQALQIERQRDDLESELAEIFERIDDGFFALDEDRRFVHLNDQAAERFGRPASELVGEPIWNARDPNRTVAAAFEAATERGESVTVEEFDESLATWFETHVYPSETGLSVYFRDVTDRKQRQKRLQRYRNVVESINEGVYIVDADGHFTLVNEQYATMMGQSKAALEGAHVSTVIDDEATREQAAHIEAALLDGGADSATLETELQRPSGESWIAEATFTMLSTDTGYERIGVVRDITERRERERELEQYERIVSTMEDGVYVLDEDFEFVEVNDAYVEMTGYDREALLGAHSSLVVGDEVTAESARQLEAMLEGAAEEGTIEADIHRADGTTLRAESRFTAIRGDDGEGTRKIGVVRDVSERVAREQELERRVRQQAVVAELGQDALESQDLDALFADASRLVADTLENDYCKVLDMDGAAEKLRLRQGVGWQDGLVGETTVSAVEDDSQAAYTLASRDPVVVEDLTAESRFSGPDLLRDHDVKSGISVIIGPYDDPWGILGTHDTVAKEFSEHDVNFVQSVATILATAIERREYERLIEQRNEALTALDSLNTVVREITDAVIEQSTREEIEATVCEHLADSDSYRFAWTGEVDNTTETVELRTEAGVSGYLDDITISMDPDDERSQGPTGRALRTGEIQITQDIEVDDRYEPWRDYTAGFGVRSSAAIPIVHEETVYGVLNVYAARANAFTGQERAVIAQLGEIVGHAIAAIERKQALMSDELVELAFRVDNFMATLGLDGTADGPIRLDHTVQVSEDDFLLFGSAPSASAGTFRAIVDAVPYYDDVTVQEHGAEIAFELRTTEPTVLSTVASLGGTIDEAVIEDGDFTLSVHLAPSVDVHQVIDAVEAAYPTARMIRRQQITRSRDDPSRDLAADLTDRQRTALETAYHAGFFEWPRNASGEEVAASLDIASPTFHQHLRKAERKVFEALLEPTGARA